MKKSYKIKNKTRLKKLVYSMMVLFILIFVFLLGPFPDDKKRGLFIFVAVLGLIFLILGIVLIVLARKEKGILRLFLMLAGISALCPLVFSILHNVFYALAMVFESIAIIFEILHGASFILALLIAPIGFIIGAIGILILLKKKK